MPKGRTIVYAVAVLCGMLARGADAYGQGVKIGIKGGLGLAHLSNISMQDNVFTRDGLIFLSNATEDDNYRIGFQAGAFVDIGLAFLPLSIHPEVYYSRQGGKGEIVESLRGTPDEGRGPPREITTMIISDYVQVPVLVRFGFPGGLHVFAGPQLGFLVQSVATTEVHDRVFPFRKTMDELDLIKEKEVKSSDFSLVFGIGIDFPSKLGVDVRYNLGLGDIRKDPENDSHPLRNRVLQLHLNYTLFKLGL